MRYDIIFDTTELTSVTWVIIVSWTPSTVPVYYVCRNHRSSTSLMRYRDSVALSNNLASFSWHQYFRMNQYLMQHPHYSHFNYWNISHHTICITWIEPLPNANDPRRLPPQRRYHYQTFTISKILPLIFFWRIMNPFTISKLLNDNIITLEPKYNWSRLNPCPSDEYQWRRKLCPRQITRRTGWKKL